MQRIIDMLNLEQDLQKQAATGRPPVHLWTPEKCLDSEMQIDAEGNWFHQGGAIERLPLCQLFASILRKDGEAYFLVTPHEKFSIEVADVPFVASTVIEKDIESQPTLVFVTTLNEKIPLNAEHALELRTYGGTLVPYIRVRDELYARISRSCYYHLIACAKQEQQEELLQLYVESQGQRYVIAQTRSS